MDDRDANRTSVLPFVEGVAKYAGDTEVFHANFYDKSSFKKALNCLCKQKFENATVYVAAHGYKKSIGNTKIYDLLSLIGEKSKKCAITGVMLGSCFAGENAATIEFCLQGSNLKWCVGYASESEWLAGTLIDCSVLMKMTALDKDDFSDEKFMIQVLSEAISHFSALFNIGNSYGKKSVPLNESLKFVIQATGQGRRAKSVSEKVFEAHAKNQLQPPESPPCA
ncbi:MAG: hypothetical protein M3R45_16755 [Pseudomonadota bacterium]|nr:hypothetical protein [Pseudomonadota bacterium]